MRTGHVGCGTLARLVLVNFFLGLHLFAAAVVGTATRREREQETQPRPANQDGARPGGVLTLEAPQIRVNCGDNNAAVPTIL